jgi:transcriptional regulator of nitric oxide reductase
VQGEETFFFVNDNFQRLGTGAADGIRAQQNAALFALPANAKFDPLKPSSTTSKLPSAASTPASISPSR